MKLKKLAAAVLSVTIAAGSMGMGLYSQPHLNSAVPLTVSAYENKTYENLTYVEDSYEHTISIIGYVEAPEGELIIPSEIDGMEVTEIGSMAFRECSGITSVVIPDTVKCIRNNAFLKCENITSLDLPDELEQIEYYAFQGCTSLTEVTIPKKVAVWNGMCTDMFKECTGLKKVTFAEGSEVVTNDMFKDCTSLETVVLPDTVQRIYPFAFDGCTSLKSITFPDSLQHIQESAFKGCTSLKNITFSKGLLSIGENAFEGCAALTAVELPEGLQQISSRAFADCKKLKTVNLPESLTSISSDAFTGTPFGENETVIIKDGTLETVIGAKGVYTIPDGVTKIGNSVFSGNKDLTGVVIPDSVTVIGMNAFSGCSALTSIDLPESIEKIGMSAFSGTGLTSVKIPEKVTILEYGLFSGCTSLKTVELHDGIKELHGAQLFPGAFSGCTALESIDIPSSVDVIGPSVFSECSSLKEITVPEGVTELGSSVFSGCTSLETIDLPDSLESVDAYTFSETPYLESLKPDSSGFIIVGKTILDGSACKGAVTIPKDVTSIASKAFNGNADITSVKFTSPLKKVGYAVFQNCSGLTSVTVPVCESLDSSMFRNCSALRSVSFAEGTKEIKNYTLSGCAALTDVTIPEGVETINREAFADCTSLKSVKLPDSIKSVKSGAFRGCTSLEEVTMPADFTDFDPSAFSNTPWYDSQFKDEDFTIVNGVLVDAKQKSGDIVIPDGVKAIANAFENCAEITSVKLPEGLETIGTDAFYGCKGLTSIKLPSTLKTLGNEAFSNCTGLTSVKLPDSVECIGESAFDSCTNLSKVEFPKTLKDIREAAFDNTAWLAAKRAEDPIVIVNGVIIDGKTATGDVVIPEGPDTIGESAFFTCQAKTVVVPESVNRILAGAFMYCPNLEKITIKNKDCYIYPGAATISNTYSVVSYYGGDIQLGDDDGGEGQTTTTTTSDGGGTGQSTTTTAASTTGDGGDGGSTTTAASTTGDGGDGGSTTAASTTGDGGDGGSTTTTADKTIVKYYGYGTVANGFYFNHDDRKFNSGHADGIDKLISVNASGEQEEVTIEKTNYTFAAASNNADNPQDTYSAEQKDFTYLINVFYDGVQVFNEDDTPMQFKVYIGVKGDGNFDNIVDSSDASAALVYYAKMSTGADPTQTRFAPISCKAVNDNPELDEFAVMLVDTDQDVLTDDNWKKGRADRIIDSNDASKLLMFYSAASTTNPDEFSAKATWNRILGY